MKHLKPYKIFEDLNIDIKSDLNDILLEVEDFGYKTNVGIFTMPDKTIIQVRAYISNENGIELYKMDDALDRAIHYMDSKGFEKSKIIITVYNEETGNYKSRALSTKGLSSFLDISRDFKLLSLTITEFELTFKPKEHLNESLEENKFGYSF